MKMNTTKLANYRIYDRTGGGVTEDIYATSLEDAIEQGQEWIENGEWSDSDNGIYRTITLECCVREIVRYPSAPAEGQTIDEDGDLLDSEGYVICTAADMGEINEDATNDGDEHDCSGTYSDELPECEAYQAAKDGGVDVSDTDDQGHLWASPYSIVGGIKENPGYWSCGGTTTAIKCVCKLCGCTKTTTDKGSQCHESEAQIVIEIEARDETAETWLCEKHSENGYLPDWLAEMLDREDETLSHMQSAVSDLQIEAQDISHGIWTEIDEQDLADLSRDEAIEWLEGLKDRLEEAKSKSKSETEAA